GLNLTPEFHGRRGLAARSYGSSNNRGCGNWPSIICGCSCCGVSNLTVSTQRDSNRATASGCTCTNGVIITGYLSRQDNTGSISGRVTVNHCDNLTFQSHIIP